VFVAWQRDAVVRHDAGLQTPTGITILESGWGTHAGNTGGRPKCMSGRQFARTGGVGSSDKPWGMQQAENPSRAERRWILLPWRFGLETGWARTRRPPAKRRAGARVSIAKKAYGRSHANAGAAGAAIRPVVPHSPSGQWTAKRRRLVLWPNWTRGD